MFFKDEIELKEYVDVNASFDFELMKPKLRQVDREVLKLHFGIPFMDFLQTEYNNLLTGDLSSLSQPLQTAIIKMREVSAPLAMSLWVTPGQLQIDSAGIFIASNENRKTAFEWQIQSLIKSYLKPAYKALEEAIFVLSDNITAYPLYASYEEYSYYKQCFIPDSKIFTRLYSPLKNSFMSFQALRSCMDKVDELDIQNVLLPSFYQELKSKLLNSSLAKEDAALLPLIRQAIANLTIYKAIQELGASFDEHGFMEYDNTSGVKVGVAKKTAKGEITTRMAYSLRDAGYMYIAKIKQLLDANTNVYTTYASDPAYKPNQQATIQNSTDQNYFIGM